MGAMVGDLDFAVDLFECRLVAGERECVDPKLEAGEDEGKPSVAEEEGGGSSS